MSEKNRFALGIDIGGTNTVFGIVDREGAIVYRDSLGTRDYASIGGFIDAVNLAVCSGMAAAGIESIAGIGIGAPNGNLRTGVIEYAPNLPWGNQVPLGDLFTQRFEVPCRITNDANAAAVGEMLYGSAIGLQDFIVITLGTGVGSGVVSKGMLVDGFDGYGGELGHAIVVPGGRTHWGTGVQGCLEAYASATGLVLTAKEMLRGKKTNESLLASLEPERLTAYEIYDCASRGDGLARAVFQYTGEILGIALANFALFSSPEAIILFGGLTNAKEFWIDTAKYHMEIHMPPNFRNKTKIICSDLKEADAAILGAASLVALQ